MVNGGAVSGATTAAIIAAKRKQIMRRFREARALSPDSAIDPASIDVRRSLLFRRMASGGLLRETEDGRWYLDESAIPAYRAGIRKRALAVSAVGLIIIVILFVVL